MNKKIIISTILVLIFSVNQTYAKGTINKWKIWPAMSVGKYFPNSKHFKYFLFFNPRFKENENLEQVVTQAALGYQLQKNVTLWMGYVWFLRKARGESNYMNEQRILQAIHWQFWQSQGLIISSRTQLEERTLEGNARWSWRFRERIKAIFPKLIANKYSLVLSNEVLLHLNKPQWVSQNTFDQNRAYIGIRIPWHDHTIFEIGYLNQFQLRSPKNRMNHVLYLAINFV